MSTHLHHAHHVRGRLRVRVAGVKGCPAQARALETSLAQINGVTQVECRPVTGSVIVHYDPSTLQYAALLRTLGKQSSELELFRPSASASSPQEPSLAVKATEVVLKFALEKAAERALPLLLAAVL